MAQATKSRSKSSTGRKGSRANSSGSNKNTGSKRSSSGAKRSSSNASRAKGKSAAASRPRSQSRSTAQNRNGAEAMKDTAITKTKGAGHAVAQAASKVKTPVIAGGTALVGAAAAAVIKDRLAANRSKSPLKRLGSTSMPKPAAQLDLRKLDLDTVKSAAERVSAYGQQASDIAAAVEKTRKKNS
jgi:hypothetical protein